MDYKKFRQAKAIEAKKQAEMAERIASSSNFNCADYCDSFTNGCTFNCGKKGREIALKWLQSEAERREYEQRKIKSLA